MTSSAERASDELQPSHASRRQILAAGLAGSALALGCTSSSGRAAPSSAVDDRDAAQEHSDAARDERDAVRADVFADLTDQRASAAPIGEDERRARRARLGKILSTGDADALLMEGGATMTYLSGVAWGHSERFFGLVVTASGEHFWISPAFEESRARLSIDGAGRAGGAIVAWQENEYFQKPLAAELARRRIQRVAIEPALRHVFVERLTAEIGRERIASGHAAVVALRGVKDAHEIELLRRANELTQRAIQRVAQAVQPGMSGSTIAAMMARAHERLGMQSPWCLALIGPAAALPHGDQENIALKRGDVLLVDTGASFHGYQSDNTRTWVFDGAPSTEVERVWNSVHDAQRAAFDAIRPGVACREIDRIARDVIDARGFGPGYATFTHRLGHGIGLEGHEDPYFDGGSSVPLASGMTLSNEPGIYLPGRFGVRLEDIVLVSENGADHFGTWQRAVTSPE
jgi:Xaa-Pro dipeptidase